MSQNNHHYDVVVIGAGPAGYVAAIRASQLGFNTACIDRWQGDDQQLRLGGTCLNVGCIPSKALLESSELYRQLQQGVDAHGISLSGVSLDLDKMMQRKEQMIEQLTSGIKTLCSSNKITLLHGQAALKEDKKVVVSPIESGSEPYLIEAQHIIIATGSRPIDIPVAPIDHQHIVDSSDALSFSEVPKRLGVIGAGVIGLELGSVWNNLGSKVILLEAQEEFLPCADRAIAKQAMRSFTQQGLDIRMGARVISTSVGKKQISVTYQEGGEEKRILVDKLLVAVGRTPNTDHLASPEVGLLLNEGGLIHVDDECRTNLPGVYAIGDVVRGPMLAHKGSEEGVAVAETIAGGKSRVNLDLIPSVVYTHPEIAWVGKSEQTLVTQGIPYNVGSFPFSANGRAKAMEQTTGQVKIIAHAESDQILGVHIIGPFASELLAQAVIAMEFEASTEDLARTIFSHPTLSEALHEAALAVDNRAIHALNRARKS